jgi:hypothetical protein
MNLNVMKLVFKPCVAEKNITALGKLFYQPAISNTQIVPKSCIFDYSPTSQFL